MPSAPRASRASRAISLKIFRSDGGSFTPGATENAKPCAWPGPWYGSCPRMTTLTRSSGVNSSARKGCGGYTAAPCASRCCTKRPRRCAGSLPRKCEMRGCQSGETGHCSGCQWDNPLGGVVDCVARWATAYVAGGVANGAEERGVARASVCACGCGCGRVGIGQSPAFTALKGK